MRRGITRRTTEELLDRIRQEVPGIVLRSSFIIGYPSETEEDVDELAEFLETQRFDRAGFFRYSQEDDTYAYILGDPIPDDVKQERMDRMMEIQRGISLTKNLDRVGSTIEVMIEERVTEDEYRGRSEADAPEVDNEVYVRSTSPLEPGSFVQVTIDDAAEFDLFGTVV
jgi:ribosomal protein S12 methylthiotransferase